MAVERNVFRGHVIAFGGEVFGRGRDELLRFLDRPKLDRAGVILPAAVLDGIERQVLGVARHADLLRASGQHVKRGVLVHGAPGTGKTHTIRYLLGQLSGSTVVVISGNALRWIAQACSVARTLQPSVVVIEDVDLIAEERGPRMGQHPLLFQLLNEMDGLGADVDVTFLLTTNRPDLLEEALAARPGRVDHAAELPIPDRDARRRLIELYRGSLVLDLADPEVVITRTEGVTGDAAAADGEEEEGLLTTAVRRPKAPVTTPATRVPQAVMRAAIITAWTVPLLDSNQLLAPIMVSLPHGERANDPRQTIARDVLHTRTHLGYSHRSKLCKSTMKCQISDQCCYLED